ncbi:MAG TPA: integrase core domain-containing protein, partial [Pseudonocardiaceae bacterium]|nr:integrase core domain-containing protein [Pseudonocardiaceae bacterium]
IPARPSTRLLDRMLILNLHQLGTVLAEYVTHFNTHRPHRTLNQAAPLPPPASRSQLRVRRRDRLGGLIHEYSGSLILTGQGRF